MKKQILIRNMNSKFKPIMKTIKGKVKKHVRINGELHKTILNQINMGTLGTEINDFLNGSKK